MAIYLTLHTQTHAHARAWAYPILLYFNTKFYKNSSTLTQLTQTHFTITFSPPATIIFLKCLIKVSLSFFFLFSCKQHLGSNCDLIQYLHHGHQWPCDVPSSGKQKVSAQNSVRRTCPQHLRGISLERDFAYFHNRVLLAFIFRKRQTRTPRHIVSVSIFALCFITAL